MRKLAPAFLVTTIVALASGSALAFGDMNKSKKAPDTTTSTPRSTAPASSVNAPAPAAAPTQPSANMPSASATTATPSPASTAPSGSTMSSSASTLDTGTAGTKEKDKGIARNDARCDKSKLAPGAALPKDCVTKSGTGAAATSSTQGASFGAGGTASGDASGSASASGSSAAGDASK